MYKLLRKFANTWPIRYIQNTTASIKEILTILGYAEPRAFVRTFKK